MYTGSQKQKWIHLTNRWTELIQNVTAFSIKFSYGYRWKFEKIFITQIETRRVAEPLVWETNWVTTNWFIWKIIGKWGAEQCYQSVEKRKRSGDW